MYVCMYVCMYQLSIATTDRSLGQGVLKLEYKAHQNLWQAYRQCDQHAFDLVLANGVCDETVMIVPLLSASMIIGLCNGIELDNF